MSDKDKKHNGGKSIQSNGGGNGDRGTSTNETSHETKSGKTSDRGTSTNIHAKDYFYDQKPPKTK